MKNELAAAWITSALADLKSIEHLKNDEFLTHIVAFHAQQCVEKCFNPSFRKIEDKLNFFHVFYGTMNFFKNIFSMLFNNFSSVANVVP